jgi:hypothetical protein
MRLLLPPAAVLACTGALAVSRVIGYRRYLNSLHIPWSLSAAVIGVPLLAPSTVMGTASTPMLFLLTFIS